MEIGQEYNNIHRAYSSIQQPFCRRKVMSDETTGTTQADIYTTRDSDNRVAIIAIVATAFVVLACIAACTFVAYAFVVNAPW